MCEATTASLEAYKVFLLSHSVKANTNNRKGCGIKKGLVSNIVATNGKEAGAFAKDLYKSVHLIKTGAGEKVVRPEDILTEEEIGRLIESAAPKLGLMIKFMARTGCRISEMLNMKLTDIKLGTSGIAEVSILGKGSKMQTVRLSKLDIREMKRRFSGGTFLFETIHGNHYYSRTNVAKQIGELSERVLGRHVNAHLFRHSFGTDMIKKTRKIHATSEYMGHTNVSITHSTYTLRACLPKN